MMRRWEGRVAVVTGTSSGIGAAIAYQLLDNGVNVVGLARRVEMIEEAVNNAREEAKRRGRYQEAKAVPGKLYPRKCDVQKEEEILSTLKWVDEKFGKVDILVNNAGVAEEGFFTDTTTEEWRRILDTNVLGLAIFTREAVQMMRSKGVDDGHIIHISSTAGYVLPLTPRIPMYSASKHAVKVLTEGLRKDIVANKNHIKVTSVSPGIVRTNIVSNSKRHDPAEFLNFPYLESEDVADAVLYALGTPPHVQVHEIILKPIEEQH